MECIVTSMKTSERIAIGLASVLVALGLYNGANVLTDHLKAPEFPEHAKFHAALGGALMLLISVWAAVMAWSTPLRRVGRGLPLTGALLAVPLSFLIAVAIVPSGSPGTSYVFLALVAVVLAVAVAVLLGRGRADYPSAS